jgi:hypothetical protein
VTGVVHPVGPEEPVVYWRRRVVLGLAALVTLIVIVRSFTGGEDPVPAACKRDVGSGANEVTVISGPALIWSTDHCNPNTDIDLVELAPGQEWNVKVVWIGKQTATGCKVTNLAEPGAYWAHGRNASLNSAGVKFVVQ